MFAEDHSGHGRIPHQVQRQNHKPGLHYLFLAALQISNTHHFAWATLVEVLPNAFQYGKIHVDWTTLMFGLGSPATELIRSIIEHWSYNL